ncbi:hypothetical protein LCGC14_2216620 [marine sediment metagenome]|uniref:Class I SAM-dependent methyltransferase n=2 Tax=root TaxID=1 RepID=A0A831QNM1_9FLAO|nr:class I SAM-dependent methyltransferase [Pricia antarctica]
MKSKSALQLVKGMKFVKESGVWADLGCGSGLFTSALASLLGADGRIFAVDNRPNPLSTAVKGNIEFIKMDFMEDDLPFTDIDGFLMANLLHYVDDKMGFIKKLVKHLSPNGQFLIVEYETDMSSYLLPFPIKYKDLQQLFAQTGFKTSQYLGDKQSSYHFGKMYVCSFSK